LRQDDIDAKRKKKIQIVLVLSKIFALGYYEGTNKLAFIHFGTLAHIMPDNRTSTSSEI
jgi:hypothetical protein